MRPRSLVVVFCLACALVADGVWAQRGGDPRPEAGQAPAGARGAGQRGGGAGGNGGVFGGRFGRGREMPTGTGIIRGRVTAQDSGAPVRRAQVRGTTAGVPFGRLATTDADGRFELRDLPAGQWQLTASKPGFVTQRLGQRRPFETVAPLDLQEGQQLASANFSMARGSAITGRLFDDFGDPVANARVQVLRSQMVDGRRRLVQTGSGDETDDTGAFRLYGLAPGDYYVAATLRAGPQDFFGGAGGGAGGGERAGYAPTYFPGTGNVSEAQRVTLGLGQEMTVSFSLLPVRSVRISGTVVSASGSPLAGGAVVLTPADGDEVGIVVPSAGPIQANGTFTISNAVPGSYVLSVRAGGGGGGGRGGGPLAALRDGAGEVGILPINVGSEDVNGVTIVTTRGGSVEGTVVFEGGTTRPRLDSLRVAARPLRAAAGPLAGRASQSGVAANGTFSLASLVGALMFRVDGLPQQWIVKSVEVGGADVTDGALEFKGTEQVTGARITLSDKVTELNGSAIAGGSAAKDYSVIVFADDPAKWVFPTRYVRSVRGNQQGSFTVRGLPPSTGYLAVAVSYLEEGEAQDPEFLRQLRDRASSVSFREGETKTVELRVIER
jgi:hypothetical protein